MSACILFRRKILTIMTIAAAAVVTYQCKSFKGANVNVRPNPLEVHADSVKFTVSAGVPPKSGLTKKTNYNGKLVIKNNKKDFDMGAVSIPGSKYPDIKKVGANVSVEVQKPFDNAMDGGMLTAVNKFSKGSKTKDLPNLDLAPCCITTSRLLCEEDVSMKDNKGGGGGKDDGSRYRSYIYSSYDYKSSEAVTLDAKFQFPQNVYDIQPSDYEQESIQKIGQFLEKKYMASKVTVKGFASPEGKFRRNQFLSIARSRQVQNWLKGQLDAKGYKVQNDSTFFTVQTTSEDWDGFKANLGQTSYSEDIKRQIIEIISAGYEEDEKEKRIMRLVGGANEVESILSPLRRATIVLEGKTSAHTDDNIKATLDGFIGGKVTSDSLKKYFSSADEMLYSVQFAGKDEDKIKVLEEFNKFYADEHRGFNNIGVLYVKLVNYDKAIAAFKSADGKKPNDNMVLNNLGVAYRETGNYAEALKYLEQAARLKETPETSYNLGIIYTKMAQYEKAIEQFDKAGTEIPCAKYNSGLCKLLLDDLAASKADLEAFIGMQKEHSLSYYLMAIVGAQSSDVNILTLNLKRAVQINKDLSPKALKDLEFRKYFENAEFKAAARP